MYLHIFKYSVFFLTADGQATISIAQVVTGIYFNTMNSWGVYIIRCKDRSLYTGAAVDVEKRFEEHKTGGPKSAKYLRGRGPLKMVWSQKIGDRATAQSLEYRLKQLDKVTKESLIKGRIRLSDVIAWV